MTWTQWNREVDWPKAMLACLLSWIGHQLSIKVTALLAAPCQMLLPAALSPWFVLAWFVGLLMLTSLAVGRWLGQTLESETRRHATVVAYAIVSFCYSWLAVSRSPVVLTWVLVNAVLTMIGAGLAHKVQWLRLPGIVTHYFTIRRRK